MNGEPTLPEVHRNLIRVETRLDEHVRSADRRMDGLVSKETFDRTIEDMRSDYTDLRDSYRKLVNVAVGEAVGLLLAIVMIAVQIALAVK